MSDSTKPRILRSPLKLRFTESTYRKAKPYLLRDFEGRCAYSLQHVERVGYRSIEVDHFNPNLKGLRRHEYTNLFPATRHSNGAKSDLWPSGKLKRMGVRFLNPTKEQDYGVHIFEDAVTHELVGASPAGRYHIRCCDLNAPHLVQERRDRAQLSKILGDYFVTAKVNLSKLGDGKLVDASSVLRAILATMIPPIAAPPRC